MTSEEFKVKKGETGYFEILKIKEKGAVGGQRRTIKVEVVK